jgi:Zn-dependent protease with chaperone function
LRTLVRAAQAVALLLGFYLVGFGIVIALLVLDIVAVRLIGPLGSVGIYMLIVCAPATVLAGAVVVRGVSVSTRFSVADLPGVPVAPDDEPELWARVEWLAQTMGMRGPRQILIGTDADAAAWERSRMLGLFPGRRYLIIGAPLLLALSPAQLDAVLAHELGHYGNKDTRLGPLVGRGRVGILMALRAAERNVAVGGDGGARRRFEPRGWWYVVLAFRAYAHVFFSLTEATSRAQEYAADRASARIAGRENTASALAEIHVISSAYQFYLDRHAYSGLPLGLLPEPAQVIGGFGSLLADPPRVAEPERLRRIPGARGVSRASRFDSHPPLADRLAALHALPDDGRAADEPSGRRAAEILRDPQGLLTCVGEKLLGTKAGGMTPVDWDSLADAVAFHYADQAAAPLADAVTAVTGVPAPTLDCLLDAVDAGRLPEILDRLTGFGAGDRPTRTAVHEDAEAALARCLRDWILVVLAERALVRWTHSWSRFADLEAPRGFSADLHAAIDALLAVEPETARLRAILNWRIEQEAA